MGFRPERNRENKRRTSPKDRTEAPNPRLEMGKVHCTHRNDAIGISSSKNRIDRPEEILMLLPASAWLIIRTSLPV